MACVEATGCDSPLREDCERSAAELVESIPTIMLTVKDASGADVTNVTVAIDGEIVATELDGKAIALDPGTHAIVLQRGGERLAQSVVVKDLEKGQPLSLRFGTAGVDDDTPARNLGGHSVWPWAVVAIGGAVIASGIAVTVTAPRLPADCDPDTRKCTQLPSETNQAFRQRQEDAGDSVGQTLVGIVVAGAGGLIVAGGLLWHFLEPTELRQATPTARARARTHTQRRITPWMVEGAGGLVATGTF